MACYAAAVVVGAVETPEAYRHNFGGDEWKKKTIVSWTPENGAEGSVSTEISLAQWVPKVHLSRRSFIGNGC